MGTDFHGPKLNEFHAGNLAADGGAVAPQTGENFASSGAGMSRRGRRTAIKMPITAAPGAHPLVRKLVDLMNENDVSFTEMSERCGWSKHALEAWIYLERVPQVSALDDCFGVFGRSVAVA